jgi:hypothetical protein
MPHPKKDLQQKLPSTLAHVPEVEEEPIVKVERENPRELQNALANIRKAPHSAILKLQSTLGNQAVQRLLAKAIARNPIRRIMSGGSIIQREVVSVENYLAIMAENNGNFALGSATKTQANKIGADWVGKPVKSKITVSNDGLRQFRKASFKPAWGEYQANVEERAEAKGAWTKNGHISIIEAE